MKTRIVFACAVPLVLLLVVVCPPLAAGPAAESSLPPRPLPVWPSERVAEGVGLADQDTLGLVLDAAGRPTLLYYRPATKQLLLIERNGDGWAESAVAGVGPAGLESALAMGPDGVAQIAYFDGTTDELIFGQRQGAGWSLAPIAAASRNLALAIDDSNRPHLIVIEADQIIYWTKQAGAWHSEPVSPDGTMVYAAFLALDSQGRPTVLYGSASGSTVAVRQAAGNWTARSLPGRGATAMALGPDDTIYLLHVRDRSEGVKPPITFISLWLAEEEAGDWEDTLLNETFWFGDDSIIDGRLLVDAAGQVHIVRRNNWGWIEYHRRDATGQWTGEDVSRSDGRFALAVDSDGRPRVGNQWSGDLHLLARDILWLDNHALMPTQWR